MSIIMVFTLIAIVRIIGIENIPFGITITMMVLSIGAAVFSIIKFKGPKSQRGFMVIMTTLVAAFLGVTTIGVILQNNYPILSTKYKPIIVIIIMILLFSIVIGACINAVIKLKNDNSTNK